jgi:acyl-coenzyme A thioesterase PaaI-like protein
MDRDPHFVALEKMYAAGPINELFQPVLEVGEGMASIDMEVSERFFHAGGALHGSVYFKMLDDAAFFAANSLHVVHAVPDGAGHLGPNSSRRACGTQDPLSVHRRGRPDGVSGRRGGTGEWRVRAEPDPARGHAGVRALTASGGTDGVGVTLRRTHSDPVPTT